MGGPGYDNRSAPGGYYSQETKHVFQDTQGGGQKEIVEKSEKKSGKGGMLAAGAGGLAVGAVGGAMVGHAMGIYSFISSSAPSSPFTPSPFTLHLHLPINPALIPLQATTPRTTNTTATHSSQATSSKQATLSSNNRATIKTPGLHRSKHLRLGTTVPFRAATRKI